MTTHELKTWPEPFAAIVDGRKRFEIRKNDRAFGVGDLLLLREWTPCSGAMGSAGFGDYTDRCILSRVTYLVPGGAWGLPADLCVMGIEPASPATPAPAPKEATGLPDRQQLENLARNIANFGVSREWIAERLWSLLGESPAPAPGADRERFIGIDLASGPDRVVELARREDGTIEVRDLPAPAPAQEDPGEERPRCPRTDGFGGWPCRLHDGHDGPHETDHGAAWTDTPPSPSAAPACCAGKIGCTGGRCYVDPGIAGCSSCGGRALPSPSAAPDLDKKKKE